MKVNNDKQDEHNLLKQIANLESLYLVPYFYLILWVFLMGWYFVEFYFCNLNKENKGFEFCDSRILNFTLFFKMSELLKISRKTGTSKMHIYFFARI